VFYDIKNSKEKGSNFMDMIKKIIVLQIFIALLLSGCSFKNKNVQVDLRVPEALVVTTLETANKIKKLQEQNTIESSKLAEKIFRERPIIEDEKVIRKIFVKLNSLQGEMIESKDKGKINGNFLFTFDLIDDKEKGLDGNDYSKDLRSITVVKEDTIVVPMLYGNDEAGLSEKSIYFIKVQIDKEFYELLEALTENP
jgi:PBP1b-binding outer membrane lipoprotein LpoB